MLEVISVYWPWVTFNSKSPLIEVDVPKSIGNLMLA